MIMQSMTNVSFETPGYRRSSMGGNHCLFDHRLKNYFLHALLMAKIAYHCLKNTKGSPLYLQDVSLELFGNHAGVRKPVFFLFVNLFRSDCQITNGDPPPTKLKPVKELKEKKKESVQSDYNQSKA